MNGSCTISPFSDHSIWLNFWRSEKVCCSLLYSLYFVAWPCVDCQQILRRLNCLKEYKCPWIKCSSIFTKVLYFSLLEMFMVLHFWSCYVSHWISHQIILILCCFFLPRICVTMKFFDYFPSHILNYF